VGRWAVSESGPVAELGKVASARANSRKLRSLVEPEKADSEQAYTHAKIPKKIKKSISYQHFKRKKQVESATPILHTGTSSSC